MRLALAIAIATGCLALASCGDDGEDATTSETSTTTTETGGATGGGGGDEAGRGEEQDTGGMAAESASGDPAAAIEAFFVSGDAGLVCSELATEELIALVYGDEAGCRAALVPEASPDAVSIEDLEVSDTEATATVIPEGGPQDGVETEVTLINEDGAWQLESLEADVPAGP